MIEKYLKFAPGDRKTGYLLARPFTVTLLAKYRFDILLGKYPPGSCQPPHVDQYKNTKLYRGAFVLKKAEKGGVLRGTSEKLISFFNGRVNFMRPDLTEHEVTVVEGNKTRWAMIATLFVDEPQEEE